jgi:flagellar basal body-associated protein FliL
MNPDQKTPEQQPQKPSKGYGKRPVWQWILIYVIIAIVVYGLIYFFFIRDTGSSGGGTNVY